MKLELPYPPSLNALFRTVLIGACARCRKQAHASLFKSDAYDEYATQLRLALLEYDVEEPLVRIAQEHDVSVTAHMYRPRRIGDLDNMFKALLDLLAGHLYENDSQISELHAFRHDDKARPRVELEVTALPSQQASLFGNQQVSRPPRFAQERRTGDGQGQGSDETLAQRLARLATPAVVRGDR